MAFVIKTNLTGKDMGVSSSTRPLYLLPINQSTTFRIPKYDWEPKAYFSQKDVDRALALAKKDAKERILENEERMKRYPTDKSIIDKAKKEIKFYKSITFKVIKI
jgi:hypothetical protein